MNFAVGLSLCAAGVYVVFAIFLIAGDRKPHRGSWINLNGILSFLVTLPVSWLATKLGRRLDHRRNPDMALAVTGTAALVALVTAALAWPFVG